MNGIQNLEETKIFKIQSPLWSLSLESHVNSIILSLLNETVQIHLMNVTLRENHRYDM